MSDFSANAIDVVDERRTMLMNRVSWGAVVAGVVTAIVVQIAINILGVGIGASALDATQSANNPDASSFATSAGIWYVVSGLLGSFVGGVVAGRLCGAGTRSTAGWHGFVSWASTTLIVVVLLGSAAGSLVGGAVSAVGNVVGGAGQAIASATGAASQAAGQSGAGNVLEQRARAIIDPNNTQTAQDNVIAYLRASAGNDQKATDDARNKAIDSVAKAANISPDEARARIEQAQQQARQAADQAKEAATRAAEATRKGLATAGLFGFGAFVIGAILAAIGGALGTPRRQLVAVASRVRDRDLGPARVA